ncbi:MAG TPA: MFS transporter [Polyangiales bacterium]
MVDEASKPQSLWTRSLLTVVATQLIFGYSASTFLLMPKYLSTVLGASPSQLGRVGALPSFAAVLAAPFVGSWLDTIGRKPLIALGTSLAAICAALWLCVDHLGPLVYVLQLGNGLAFMLTFNASGTLVTDKAPPERLGQAIGIFGAANMSMSAIAPAAAEALVARAGWRAAFALAACAALCALALSRRIDEPARNPGHAPRRPSLAPTLALVRRLSPQAFTMVTCGAAYGAVFTYYQPFVLSQGAKHVSAFFIGFTLAALATRLGLGSLPDRLGRQRVALGSYAFYACTVLAMTQLLPSRLFVLGLLFGCAHGFFYPALNALCVEQTRPEQRGRVMTLVNGSFQLGNMSSVLAFGWVAERYGYPRVFVLAAAITCLGLAALYGSSTRSPARDPSQA